MIISYTDSNLTNPLPDGYYYCSANSEEAGGVTYTALPGLTHKGIQVENGVAVRMAVIYLLASKIKRQ